MQTLEKHPSCFQVPELQLVDSEKTKQKKTKLSSKRLNEAKVISSLRLKSQNLK